MKKNMRRNVDIISLMQIAHSVYSTAVYTFLLLWKFDRLFVIRLRKLEVQRLIIDQKKHNFIKMKCDQSTLSVWAHPTLINSNWSLIWSLNTLRKLLLWFCLHFPPKWIVCESLSLSHTRIEFNWHCCKSQTKVCRRFWQHLPLICDNGRVKLSKLMFPRENISIVRRKQQNPPETLETLPPDCRTSLIARRLTFFYVVIVFFCKLLNLFF